jgi:TolA-binding protein
LDWRAALDGSQSRIGDSESKVRAGKVRTLLSPQIIRDSVLAGVLGSAVAALAQQGAPTEGLGRPSPPTTAGQPRGGATASGRDAEALRFAYELLGQRKYDLAGEEFERLIRSGASGHELIDARFGLANARLYQSRYREARTSFGEFLAAAPGDSRALTARYRLGELAYVLGDLAGARRELETFTATKANHPGMEMAWTYLGDACFALKELAQARRAYEHSLSAFPKGRLADRARYGLARTLAGLGDQGAGLRLLDELTKQQGSEWCDRAWLQIGLIRESAGQFAEAERALGSLERASADSPLRQEARLHRARALAHLSRTEEAEGLLRPLAVDAAFPSAAQAALELATIELAHGLPEAALGTLEQALKDLPRSPSAPALLFRSAEALSKLNRLVEAQARFLRVSETDPDDPWADDALARAAQTALDRREAANARRLAAGFAARFPHSPLAAEVRLIEARAAGLEGKPQDAAAILESLLGPPARKPAGHEAPVSQALAAAIRYELALAYRSSGRQAEAEQILTRLAEGPAGPVAADAQFLLGQAHVEAGRYEQAKAALEQYLAANPKGDVVDVALAQLAAAHLGCGQLDLAWKTLETLARRFPESKALPSTRIRLGEAALLAHQADRAAGQFRLVASTALATSERAKSKGRMSVPSAAAEGASRERMPPVARVGGPEDNPSPQVEAALQARAWSGLGKALAELGQPDQAAAAFAAFLALAADDPAAPEIALARGRVLETSGDLRGAVDAYAQAARRYAKTGQGLVAEVARLRLLARTERHQEAARGFEKLMGDDGALATLAKAGVACDALLADWGWALVDAQQTAGADRVFRRLLKEYPSSPYADDARFNLAESANQAGDRAEVIRLLRDLAAPRPRQPAPGSDSQSRAGQAPAFPTGRLTSLLPAALYRLGRTQIDVKDFGAACGTLDRLLREYPDSTYRREACFLRAFTLLRRGDPGEAELALRALLAEPARKTDPAGFVPAVRLQQLECWVALKRWKDVVEGSKRLKDTLAENDPAAVRVDYAFGQALLGLARLDEARAAFQSVVDRRSSDELAAQAQLMLGETYFHEDQLHEALRAFLKVDFLYNAPTWQAGALLEAGKVYERLDQWADAAETYERLLAKFPRESSAALAQQRLDHCKQRTAAPAAESRGK